ncbi:hypothetical protein OESDEN_24233, partial [Oesophagostomum dentatum]
MLPRLEKLTSIQILLEIGVERFRRDMAQAYISAGFMTSDSDLDFKPQPNALPEERARALLPLHLALQTMLEMKGHLALPPHILTTMTRSVVSKYCSQPISDITKVFYETAVPLIHVQPGLLQKLPDLWSNETVYSHGNTTVASTLVHFTRDPKLRHLEGRTVIIDQEGEENEELDKRSAFLCTYTTTSYLTAEDMEDKKLMEAPEAELINEFEFQHYGFSPAGFTDSIYNIAVETWQAAVEEICDPSLGKVADKKKFMAQITGMIFTRQEVREAFKTFTDRVLKYILRIPPYVTLPEHQATHELLLAGERDVEEIESDCKKLEDEIVE